MASQKLDDCYFYYYSSCTKGDDCPYRHCKLALGSEVVCTLWREGRCFRNNCKFRHMESQVNRSAIPCYWENQPGGCRKPHCVFYHRKLRSGVLSDPRLILPVSNGNSSPIPSDPKNPNSPSVAASPSSPQGLANDLISEPASVPVPRLVLSFDEGEESDTESVSSTPIKAPSDDNKNLPNDPAKRNINSKFAAKTDFGIKTLEQIRMEKIHKESNHYYSGYDAPSLESPHSIEQHSNEYYPPQSDFISLPSSAPLGKSLVVPSKEVTQQSLDLESDLRTRLFKRVNRKAVADMQVVNNKQQQKKKSEERPKNLNFKIKTLEEIRMERENKRGLENGSTNSSSDLNMSSIENKSEHNDSLKSSKRPRITRKSKELYAKAAANKSEAEKSLPVNSAPQEKRKLEDSELNRHSKLLKVDSGEPAIQNGSLNQTEIRNKQVVKSLGSFLRRSKAKTSPSSDRPSVPLTAEANDNKENDDITMSSVSADPSLENIESTSPIAASPTTSPTTTLIESHSNDQLSSVFCFEPNLAPEDGNLEMSSATSLGESEKVKDTNVEMERSVSVDELDSFLDDGDMDEGADSAYGDDILLEVEQFLDS